MLATFTDRFGGTSQGAYASLNLGDHVGDDPSAVLANREIIRELHGPVQFMEQVHGNRIVVIEKVTQSQPTADAMVTGIPGISLAVMVADCIPLLLTSREAVAAVHVGRRGLVNEIALKTIEVMRDMGAQNIGATIGPAICGNCYEVSKELHDEVSSRFPLASSKTHLGTPALDLPKALTASLQSVGVIITSSDEICTVENSDYFSYRRDGITGRQIGLVGL